MPAASHCAVVAREPFAFLLRHLKKDKFCFLPSCIFCFKAMPSASEAETSQPRMGSQCWPPPERNMAAPRGLLGEKDVGLGGFSSPRAAWGNEPCGPRLQVQTWMYEAGAVLLGQDGRLAAGSCSQWQGGSPVLPAPLLLLPKGPYLSQEPLYLSQVPFLPQPGTTLPQPGAISTSTRHHFTSARRYFNLPSCHIVSAVGQLLLSHSIHPPRSASLPLRGRGRWVSVVSTV